MLSGTATGGCPACHLQCPGAHLPEGKGLAVRYDKQQLMDPCILLHTTHLMEGTGKQQAVYEGHGPFHSSRSAVACCDAFT